MGEVVGDNTPTNPFIEAILAMIETAVELMFAFQDTNAPFDTGMEMATACEPSLLFMLAASIIFMPGFRQDDPFDTFGACIHFVVWRVETAVGTGLPRRMTKALEMMVRCWLPLFFFRGIALKELPTGDDAAIHLIEPDFVAKLGLFARLLALNDRGMRFKEADNFLGCGDSFPMDDSTNRLVNRLFDARQIRFYSFAQLLGRLSRCCFEGCHNGLHLTYSCLRYGDQSLIGRFHLDFGRRTALPGTVGNPMGLLLGT